MEDLEGHRVVAAKKRAPQYLRKAQLVCVRVRHQQESRWLCCVMGRLFGEGNFHNAEQREWEEACCDQKWLLGAL